LKETFAKTINKSLRMYFCTFIEGNFYLFIRGYTLRNKSSYIFKNLDLYKYIKTVI